MPLASGTGPRWTRPLVKTAEERLAGVNPIRRYLAALFGRKTASARHAAQSPPLPRDPSDAP